MMSEEEKRILEEIESGKYSGDYLYYSRRSEDEPNNQINSLSFQKSENMAFAKKESLSIAPITLKGFCVDGIISESHTGFKEDDDFIVTQDGMAQFRIERPKFQRLLSFLSRGLFKGVICLSWDRISRNDGDGALVRKLMRKGIDFRFAWATYDKSSSGELHKDIDGMFAKHHSRITSEKVTAAVRKLRKEGICTYRARIGYLNMGRNMHKKPLDTERAPIIKRIAELAATGEWTLSDLAKWANEQGLTTPPTRRKRTEEEMLAEEGEVKIEKISRPVTPNTIHRILTSRFYLGEVLDENRKWIKSNSHDAMFSEELFNKIQEVLRGRKVSLHYIENLDLPYRGLPRCNYCTRVYTPYKRKGILYFNSRCVSGCENKRKNINVDFLEGKIGGLIGKLSFTPEELDKMDASSDTDIALLEEKRQRELEQNDRRQKTIREDLSYLNSNRLMLLKSGVYTPQSFLEEEGKLNSELTLLQNEEQASDMSMHEVVKDVVKLSELLKGGVEHWALANSQERERIARIVFSELLVSENTFDYKCKNGFQALERRFIPECAGRENRTPVSSLARTCSTTKPCPQC